MAERPGREYRFGRQNPPGRILGPRRAAGDPMLASGRAQMAARKCLGHTTLPAGLSLR